MFLYWIYLACLLLSALASFFFRKNLQSRQLSIFIPFLFLLFIQELTLILCVLRWPKISTGIVYNIYQPICVIVMAAFYYSIPFNSSLRKLIIWLLSIYLVVVIFTFAVIQPINIYNSYLSLAGGLVITCNGIFFLFNYFNLDNPTQEKHWLPALWITIGIVAFYPVVNISFAFYKHLVAYRAEIFGLKLYRIIPQLMSIFMYSCFTYAFYLCKKKN